MQFSQKIANCRAEIIRAIEKRDANAAKLSAVAYAKLLREMASIVTGKNDRESLENKAKSLEVAAVLFASEGITERAVALAFDKPISSSSGNHPTLKGDSKRHEPTPTPTTTPAPTVPVASADEWVADMFERYIPATLALNSETGAGTGFFISKDGLLLTNHHVAYKGKSKRSNIWVKSGDGKINSRAEIIAADRELDVALLRATSIKGSVPFIPLIKNYADVRVGTDVMLIGNGLNSGLAPISGTIKFTNDKFGGNLVYTAPSNNGDSGSPVINRHGECIGIHKSSTQSHYVGINEYSARGLANATGADNIHKLLDKWSKEYKL